MTYSNSESSSINIGEETKLKMMSIEEEEFLEEETPIIEQILDKYGYGVKTWVHIFYFLVCTISDGLILYYFSFLIVPFKEFYDIKISTGVLVKCRAMSTDCLN